MISIQYINTELDEERFSAHENSSNAELLALRVSFKQLYIDKTDSWTEYLALWIWFTSTVAVCRPAVSIDVSSRILSSPIAVTRCLFAINNSVSIWSAPN